MSLTWRLYIILCVTSVVYCEVEDNEQSRKRCFEKFQNANAFNVENMLGVWYPIYYWPKELVPRQCIAVTFKEVVHSETGVCKEKIPEGEKVMQSTYTTKDGKTVVQYLYGGDVKHFSVDFGAGHQCDLLDGYLTDLGDGYVLTTICPYGFYTLIARNLTSSSELQSLVNNIDLLKGIEGGSNCV